MAEINLFKTALNKVRKRQKVRNMLFRSALIASLVLSLLMVVVSGYSLLISRKNQNLSLRIDGIKNQIKNLSSLESKQVYLISKIESFAEVLKTQEKHQAVAETVFALLPEGTSLKGFQISEDGLINLSGTVPDYPTFIELIGRIKKSQQLNLPVTDAKVVKVGQDSQGGLNFSIQLNIAVNS